MGSWEVQEDGEEKEHKGNQLVSMAGTTRWRIGPTLTIALICSSSFTPPLPLKTSRNSLRVEMSFKKKLALLSVLVSPLPHPKLKQSLNIFTGKSKLCCIHTVNC